MRRVVAALVAAPLLLSFAACSESEPTKDVSETLMERCIDFGGTYYEYEDTSAGWHIWCVTPEGVDIADNVREGDR